MKVTVTAKRSHRQASVEFITLVHLADGDTRRPTEELVHMAVELEAMATRETQERLARQPHNRRFKVEFNEDNLSDAQRAVLDMMRGLTPDSSLATAAREAAKVKMRAIILNEQRDAAGVYL